jgi:hypothetical protein
MHTNTGTKIEVAQFQAYSFQLLYSIHKLDKHIQKHSCQRQRTKKTIKFQISQFKSSTTYKFKNFGECETYTSAQVRKDPIILYPEIKNQKIAC